MKNKTAQQIRVGIFVTVGLFLTMVVTFLLGDVSGLLEKKFTLYARFQDISGLRLGAPVFLAGINVGKVQEIHFPQILEEKKVVIVMGIRSNYQDRIRQDSTASIVTQGLLGDKAIFLTVGQPQFDKIADKGEIQVKDGLSLDNFAEKGGELLENVNALAKNVNGVIEDVKKEKGLVYGLIYDPKGKQIIDNLASMLDTAQGVLQQVQHGRGVLHALIYDPTTRDLGKELSKTVANFQTMSTNLRAISDRIEQGEGSVGGLINDPTVYYDLMTLLGNANRNKLLRTVIRATLATNEKDLVGD